MNLGITFGNKADLWISFTGKSTDKFDHYRTCKSSFEASGILQREIYLTRTQDFSPGSVPLSVKKRNVRIGQAKMTIPNIILSWISLIWVLYRCEKFEQNHFRRLNILKYSLFERILRISKILKKISILMKGVKFKNN